jgi:hypothetical protein
VKLHARSAAAAAVLVCAVGAAAPLGTAGTTADHPLQVTINGKPETSSGPQVSAELLYDGSDQWLLMVTNSAKNPDGEDITSVDGAIDPGLLQQHAYVINRVSTQDDNASDSIVASSQSGFSFSFSTAAVNVCFEPKAPQTSFTCPTVYAGFGAGMTQQYLLITTDTDERPPLLSSIDIKMKIGACDPPQTGTRELSAARDDDCALPGVTKIKKANVRKAAGSATFTYAAPHARTYVCELLSNKRIVSRTSCNSAHGYARLRHGTYFFVVWAVNRAGIAKKATVYGFKIG